METQRCRMLRALVLAGLVALSAGGGRRSRADDAPAVDGEVEAAEVAEVDAPASRAIATNRYPDRPSYVGALAGKLPVDVPGWLELGIEQRTRWELRDDYYRAGLQSDDQVLLRTRGFLGVRDVLDPLRFGFEFQDARVADSEFPETTRDVDEADILQLFGELRFEDALGPHEPVSVRFGRMSFDAVDRRLLARNRFRNTTNAFDGVRVRVGEADSLWEVDALLTRPVERFARRPDHADDERVFGGLMGYYRGLGPAVVIEPYWFVLDEHRKTAARPDRHLHTLGVHTNGLVGETGFDHDLDVALQVGESGGLDHLAAAFHAEAGYSIDAPWDPRVALWLNFATGDADPGDGTQSRFDPLFGAAHAFYGYTDFFGWQNLVSPAAYVQVRPVKGLRLEAIWRSVWLASERDAFVRAGIRDPTGASGSFVGHEIDLRARYRFCPHASVDIGYAHFVPGAFTERAGMGVDADFVYVALVSKL